MLQIPCPNCGVRDEVEFTFGGPSKTARPATDVSDLDWTDYLFNQENPKGALAEWWCHYYGCERWFVLVRDTLTHEISPPSGLSVVTARPVNS